MVNHCCVRNCKETFMKGGKITFHSIPLNEERRKKWLANIRRKDFIPGKYTKICSKHFEDSCFDKEKFGGHWLKATAVPTIFDHEPYYSADGERCVRKVTKAKVPASNRRPRTLSKGNRNDLSSISSPTAESAQDYWPLEDLVAKDMNSLAKEKLVLPQEKTQGPKNKSRKRKELKTDEDEVIEYIEELEARKRASQCVVCSRSLINGRKECLSTLTSTTGLSLLQCLTRISGNKCTMVKECSASDIVCHFCAHLINYADKLEAELTELKAALNGCLQIKSLGEEDQEMLKPQFDSHVSILDEFSDRVVGPGSAASRHNVTDKVPDHEVPRVVVQEVVSVSQMPRTTQVKENIVNSAWKNPIQRNIGPSIPGSVGIPGPVLVDAKVVNSLWRNTLKTKVEKLRAHKPDSSDPPQADSFPELVCKICNLKTSSRSVLFFHLRRHMANYQWCDFCDAPLYDDETEAKRQKKSEDPT